MNMSKRQLACFLVLLAMANLVYLLVNITTNPVPAPQTMEALGRQGPRNSTLGFHKIFYLSMPERTDRRDMMNLISGYLNLDFVAVDSVNGSLITEKAMPYDVRNPPTPEPGYNLPRPAEVGCWRAHANIWSHIVSSGISSALILEDDVDFSVGIREIMEGISTQLQGIFGARKKEPYGLVDGKGWDILSLGTCWSQLPDPETDSNRARMVRSWIDQYAPESDRLSRQYLPNAASKRVRLIGPTKSMVCTHGYAVTREGAMRLLYNVGGPGHILDRPLDLLMNSQIIGGLLRGFIAIPTIVGQWKYGNWMDSDIQPGKTEGSGSGSDIIQSVRKEIMEVLGNRNAWTEFES